MYVCNYYPLLNVKLKNIESNAHKTFNSFSGPNPLKLIRTMSKLLLDRFDKQAVKNCVLS